MERNLKKFIIVKVIVPPSELIEVLSTFCFNLFLHRTVQLLVKEQWKMFTKILKCVKCTMLKFSFAAYSDI